MTHSNILLKMPYLMERDIINFILDKKQNKMIGVIFGILQDVPKGGKIHIFQPYQEVVNPNENGGYKFVNPDNPNDYITYP